MADSIDIRVLGDKNLQRKLSKLATAVQKRIVRQSMREGAKIVLAEAKINAPGRIKQSLHIRSRSTRGQINIRVQTRTREWFGIPKKDKYFYPALIEYGAKAHVIQKAYGFLKVNHPGFIARPYLRPAMENNRQRVLTTVSNNIRRKIESEVR